MPGMAAEAGGRVCGDGECTRSDRDVRTWNSDDVDHQRYREDRAATANQPEDETDQAAGDGAQEILEGLEGHGCGSAAE